MGYKIAHVIVGLNNGGAELMLLRLIQSNKWNNNYIVISLTDFGANGSRFVESDVPVVFLNMNNFYGFISSPFRLYSILRRFRPVIVQTWMVHSDLIGGLVAWIAGVPHILWGIRTTDYSVESRSTRFFRWLSTKFSHFIPKKIICAANSSCNDAIKNGYDKNKILTIHNGFDYARMTSFLGAGRAIRKSLSLDSNTLLIGCLGRYVPAKDHANFVAAAGLLAGVYPFIHFLMVGRDLNEENLELKQLIEATGVPERFILLGERTDPAACLDAMDVFVLSSCTEGFPNVLGEAMSMGLPCVSTDVGDAAVLMGSREWLVPARDSRALADKLSKLLSLPVEERKRLGALARQRVEDEFSMSTSAQKFMDLYTSLMKPMS